MSETPFVPIDEIHAKFTWYRLSPVYGPDELGYYWARIGAQDTPENGGVLARQNCAKPEWAVAGSIAGDFVEWFYKQMLPVAVELSDPMGVQLADPKSAALETTPC